MIDDFNFFLTSCCANHLLLNLVASNFFPRPAARVGDTLKDVVSLLGYVMG